MGRSSQEKINWAVELLKQGKTFRDIQKKLKQKFNSTMSFSTLSKLKKIQATTVKDTDKIHMLKQELKLFKKLYFELLEKVNLKEKLSPREIEGEKTSEN